MIFQEPHALKQVVQTQKSLEIRNVIAMYEEDELWETWMWLTYSKLNISCLQPDESGAKSTSMKPSNSIYSVSVSVSQKFPIY